MADVSFEHIAAGVPSGRGLRQLPGKDALLFEIHADDGVVVSPTAVNTRGASVPVVTLSGSGPKAFQLDIKIASVAGGTALGQATYQVSLNGGSYSSAAATTATPIAIGNGYSFAFAAGTYATSHSWRTMVTNIANRAASGASFETTPGCYGLGYVANARAGLPGFNFDVTISPAGTEIQSLTCSAITATPDAPFSAIWICKYASTDGNTWGMGAQNTSDGSAMHITRGAGATVDYARRSHATALQTLPLWTDDGAWHVFGARYTGTQMEFWVDGAKVLPLTTLAATGTKDMSNANMLRIGAIYDDTVSPGNYQSFAAYKRFLTDYEFAVCTRAIQKRFRFV